MSASDRSPPSPENQGVRIAVMQVDYDTRKRADDKKVPVIHVYGRNADDGSLEHVRVHGFEPYFYVGSDEISQSEIGGWITDIEEWGKDLKGRRVSRVTTRLPDHVGNLKGEYEVADEADILFPDRFLIDKGIKSGIKVPEKRTSDGTIDVREDDVVPVEAEADPRVFTFDIEVEDRNGFPEDGEEPLICITSHDSKLDVYTTWIYLPAIGGRIDDIEIDFEKVGNGVYEYAPETVEEAAELPFGDFEPIRDGAHRFRIAAFGDESSMVEAFVSHIEELDPTVITGWNSNDFDIPYLINRMKRLDSRSSYNFDPDRLARFGGAWVTDYGDVNIKGRVAFDLLHGYKRMQFTEPDSFRLGDIGKMELGRGKETYDGDIGDLWEDDVMTLLEYSFRDVEICVELNRGEEIIPFWNEVRRFVGCRLGDAPTPGDSVDMYILHQVHGKYVLPSKGEGESEYFEGGNVFDPYSGVLEYVTTLDLKSLYPMCMTTINASPETKVDPETYDGETYRAPNGVHFKKEPDGIMREIVNELLEEREKKKEIRNEHEPGSDKYELYDMQQGAVKVIMNSLYGTLGWERFRLYDKEMAAGVTATARAVIKYTANTVGDLGYDIVYGDTDSVLLDLSGAELDGIDIDPTEHSEVPDSPEVVREKYPDMDEEVIEQATASIWKMKELEILINDAYADFCQDRLSAEEHDLKIESEKLYRRFFQAGKKKRYAGHIIWKEGKYPDDIDITGFEYKRSDSAGVTDEVQHKTIEMIVKGRDQSDIRYYLERVVNDFRDGEYSPGEIGIPSGIGKDLQNYDTKTAHVKGAMASNAVLGTNFGKGSKPKRIEIDKLPDGFIQSFKEEHKNGDGWDLSDERREGWIQFKRDMAEGDGVLCFHDEEQLPDGLVPDYEEMLDKTVRGPVERVITAIGMDWDAVTSGQQQTGIGQFM